MTDNNLKLFLEARFLFIDTEICNQGIEIRMGSKVAPRSACLSMSFHQQFHNSLQRRYYNITITPRIYHKFIPPKKIKNV